MTSRVIIRQEVDLTVSEFVDVLNRSTLSERRPVDQPEQIEGMLQNADLLITARTSQGLLVGISRALTDFHYCTYLSDLAVDVEFQHQGIGKRLVEETHRQAGLNTHLVLLAAPAAQKYYGKIGMQQHPSCWTARPVSE